MSKEAKTPKKAPSTPKQDTTPTTKEKVDFKELIEAMGGESERGLDPNHQVDLLNLAHDIYGKDKNAEKRYNLKPEFVENMNKIVAIGVAVAMSREVIFAKNPFAILLNKAELKTIQEICSDIGISINANLLPAPDKDGTIEIPSEAIEVSSETKDKIEEEEAIRNEEVETDPTKIETEEQLIAALKNILVTRNNAFQKVNDSVNFYQAYLKIQASKAENKEEELKKVNDMSRVEILKNMAKLIGACPLVLNGVGRYMFGVTSQSKNPISAFCAFRNTTRNKVTGAYAISDAEVADYVRILIEWTGDIKKEEEKKRLETLKDSLEILKKDEKANAGGISDLKEKIRIAENNIKHFDDVLAYVLNPSADVPSTIMEGYMQKDMTAMRTFRAIADSYYDDIVIKEMKQDGVRHNIEQYAGIIINLFREPSSRIEKYSESNLIQLEPISTEEKPAEEAATEESKKD